jgi:hypothetical protein
MRPGQEILGRYYERMGAGTLIPVDTYLQTSYQPDCDYIDGEVVERNVGKRRHGYALTRIAAWFVHRLATLHLEAITELRIRVSPSRIRIPDVVVSELPLPDEEVFTSPPYLCIESNVPGRHDCRNAGPAGRLS